MATHTENPAPASRALGGSVRYWMMIALTVLFVSLYAAALLGWLRPLSDVSVIARLEPILFVILGYYFGRVPAEQNERALKEEIGRQADRADAIAETKEQAEIAREAAEERMRNITAALATEEASDAEVEKAGVTTAKRILHSIR